MKANLEPGNYLAYCRVAEKYNRDTGEIYHSDIVFNPILYDTDRYNLEIAERFFDGEIEDTREAIRDQRDRDLDFCDRVIRKEDCYRDVENFYDNKEDELDEISDNIEESLEDKKEDIYTQTLKTMIHELGHSLGYAHTPQDIENIMYNNNYGGSILTGRQVKAVLCAFGLQSDRLY